MSVVLRARDGCRLFFPHSLPFHVCLEPVVNVVDVLSCNIGGRDRGDDGVGFDDLKASRTRQFRLRQRHAKALDVSHLT